LIRLSVNVNKVATLRNARGGDRPSVLGSARTALTAGAHGITVHPRPDERHVRRADVIELARELPAGTELNVEGYPGEEWLELVERVRPVQATLVPDPPGVLTSDAGWRFETVDRPWLAGVVARLRAAGCRVSLFVDAEPAAADGARAAGADRIELYTGPYARAAAGAERERVFAPYRETARRAGELGLGVNAGHDLDLDNLPFLAANLPGLAEVSIGHALVSDALESGLAATVRAYLAALGGAAAPPAAGRAAGS
jgi:pyridoxine 5-phosphate synthase